MKINFEKYQGTGNDFILIDDRENLFPKDDIDLINRLCDRHFGVGSDGLMLIRKHSEADFEMVFFNPDGSKSLCGNGSRCAVAFAVRHNIAPKKGSLLTTDGIHQYTLNEDKTVTLQMRDVSSVQKHSGHWFIHSGSPHLVVEVEDLDGMDVVSSGRHFRYEGAFIPIGGTNVNFVEKVENGTFKVRTYERGVEAETLSCGTGVTAVALAMQLSEFISNHATIITSGGKLEVDFKHNDGTFEEITLKGPAEFVFSGEF